MSRSRSRQTLGDTDRFLDDRPADTRTKRLLRANVHGAPEDLAQMPTKIGEAEQADGLRELHENVHVARRARLVACHRSEEPQGADEETALQPGQRITKDLQGLIAGHIHNR